MHGRHLLATAALIGRAALGACGVGSVGDGILSDVAWTDIIDAANDLMPRRWKHCVAMSWWLWAWSFPARFREP